MDVRLFGPFDSALGVRYTGKSVVRADPACVKTRRVCSLILKPSR
jgi:hypothetical protein